ncbi:MAG: B12-binding domain-containing radical SAM protein [Negativicutes bacterium]|nr:B12-binding domain-containing radical SAM protein [Negativicutes bacterium]
MKVVLATLNAKYIHSALALYYLKAYCEQDGFSFVVKEYSVNNGLLDILSDIYSEKPEVVGLACYIWNIEMTAQLVALIRKVLPKTVIVLGGPEVTYDAAQVMQRMPSVDYIIRGEGEEVLAALLQALNGNGMLKAVPGLVWRSGQDIICNGDPQVVNCLDSIPFPYTDQDMAALKDKIIYYESSRGCPFSCQYCLSSATAGVRFLPLERVLQELAFFIRHGVKQVKFVDRTFNARKDHYLPIIRFLAKQDCTTNFHFEIAADILDDETLAVLAQAPAGRFQLEIGIQSTHQPTLQAIRRTNQWPAIVYNVNKLLENGNIHLHLDLIVGLPYEDIAGFGRSFNDVYALKPHMLQLGFLKLLKGSGIRSRAAVDGYVFMDNAPYEILANNYISYQEIRSLKIMEEVFNQTYNSGRFKYTLEWFVTQKGDAFSFYRDFAAYWEERGLHRVSHSAKSLYRFLLDYCEHIYPHHAKAVDELLKFDALLSEHGGLRPEFLSWNGEEWAEAKSLFFRDENKVRHYLPQYVFTNWRDVKKRYHIEIFAGDVTCPGSFTDTPTALLFQYQEGRASYQKVKLTDLAGKKEAGI